MPANPNWARWIFSSVADVLKQVATENNLPAYVDHLDERTDAFMKATDRVEIRITGPFVQEISEGYFKVQLEANVLLTSRYDGTKKNALSILKYAGLFQEAMDSPIPIWNFGNEPGDFVEGDPDTQLFLGCLTQAPGRNDAVRVLNFGQIDKTDKVKQTVVDARYVIYLEE